LQIENLEENATLIYYDGKWLWPAYLLLFTISNKPAVGDTVMSLTIDFFESENKSWKK
jgi:hypothetical protein